MIGENSIKFDEIKSAINNQCLKFLGELNFGKAGLIHLDDFKDGKGIIKINSKYLNEVKMSLALVENINGKKVIVDAIGVSGTLAKARLRYFKKEEL